MLSDEGTYTKLDSDPTPTYWKKLVSIFDQMRSENKVTTKWYQHLNPTSENQNIPRMYCTPKIHKTGNPLRPIVDYTVSRESAHLLAPLVIYHLHVTVYCLIHLQYCDSSPEEASRSIAENLTSKIFVLSVLKSTCYLLMILQTNEYV